MFAEHSSKLLGRTNTSQPSAR